jgi:hypothetical protein
MGVSYIKNKQHIYNWRETHREEYKASLKKDGQSPRFKLYQAKYRLYKRECNRLMAIDV